MLDIELFCQLHGLEYADQGHHHCHEGWVQLHCQFCAGGMGGFHLGFSVDGGNFNCWRCGPHSAFEVIGAVLGTRDQSKIRRAYAEAARKGAPKAKRARAERARTLKRPPGAGRLSKQHKSYLTRRDFSPTALEEEWELLGTTHLGGQWAWRVVAPIHDPNGRVVAYNGRTIRKAKPKYKVTEDEKCLVDPKTLIYGIHKVPDDAIVIVEGMTDVWRLGPGAAALLGVDFNVAQTNQLRRFKRRFILMDPDIHGQRRAERLAERLALFPGETEIIDGFDTDPGGFSEKQAAEIMGELL